MDPDWPRPLALIRPRPPLLKARRDYIRSPGFCLCSPHGCHCPEVRRQQRRRRPEAPARRRARDAHPRAGPRRRRGRLGDGRHHRRSARHGEAGLRQPRSPRARHAALRRRAHLDGAALDGDPRAGRRRHQLHRQPVRHHHQRPPRRRAHHRGAPVPRAGRARARQDRRHRRLPGRLLQEGGHDARAAAAATRPRWRWRRRSTPSTARSAPTSTASTRPTRASSRRRGASARSRTKRRRRWPKRARRC